MSEQEKASSAPISLKTLTVHTQFTPTAFSAYIWADFSTVMYHLHFHRHFNFLQCLNFNWYHLLSAYN